MNEILKFRCWDNQLNEWIRPNSIVISLDGEVIHYDKFGRKHLDYVIQQYSGMVDKNGREIFEGDIVRGHHLRQVEVVVRRGCGFGIMENVDDHRTFGKFVCFDDDFQNSQSWEIVGNIFENSDLLIPTRYE